MSLLLVIVLAFGVQSVSFASEVDSGRTVAEIGETDEVTANGMINLLEQQTYYTVDANGNIEIHTKNYSQLIIIRYIRCRSLYDLFIVRAAANLGNKMIGYIHEFCNKPVACKVI